LQLTIGILQNPELGPSHTLRSTDRLAPARLVAISADVGVWQLETGEFDEPVTPDHVGCGLIGSQTGLVDEPAVADTVTAWPCRVDDERGEALNPPVDGDVVGTVALSDRGVRRIGVASLFGQIA
jgi:hypothetical protein